MRRLRRRKLILYVLFLSNFIFCVFYVSTNWAKGVWSEDAATEAILKAVRSKGEITSNYVLPNIDTAIVEPSPTFCEKRGVNIHVLFMVVSAPQKTEARDAIRSSLKAGVDKLNEERLDINTHRNNSVLFFIGSSEDPSTQRELEAEATRHGDIVIDSILDAYLNLTAKVLRMLKWTESRCSEIRFLFKVDDDVHVNLIKVLEYLVKLTDKPHLASDLIAGPLYTNKAPIRTCLPPNGKWFAPPEVWPEETYPDFCGGPSYILGSGARSKIYRASLSQPLLHLEDVFITGVIGNRLLGLKLTGMPGMEISSGYRTQLVSSCFLQQQRLVIHPVSPKILYSWRHFNSRDYICSCWPLFFATYFS